MNHPMQMLIFGSKKMKSYGVVIIVTFIAIMTIHGKIHNSEWSPKFTQRSSEY